MKIQSLILAAAALVLAAGCNKELPEGAPEAAGETVVFTASMDGADSKAVLNETTRFSEWEAGDKVTIHNGVTGFEFTAAGAGASTELSYTGTGFSGNKFMAVYPAGTYNADVNAKTVNAYIPTWQQAQTGTYHHDAALAVAYSENNNLTFKNVTSLLKFTVNTDNVTHVVFHGNLGEGITGNVSVSLAEGAPKVEVLDTEFTEYHDDVEVKVSKKGSWVQMYAYHDDEHRYFEKGETYYIAVAPQTFAEGVTVKLRINEGEELVVRTTSKSVTFNAGTIYNLGEFVYEAPAATPKVDKVYLRPGVWSADGAWFSAHFWGAKDEDMKLTEEQNGLFSVSVSEGQTGMKLCRMNPKYDVFSWNNDTENDHVWTETENLDIPEAGSDKVCYVVKDWDAAEWMTIEDALAYVEEETPPTPDVPLPSGQCEWGLIGQHQGWSWENLTPMTLVQGNIYAAKDVQLVANGFKFAKFGGSWDNGATYFGAYQNTEGKEYFDWQTQGMTGWYEVWDDNLGGQSSNIGVNDFTRKYDIYLMVEPINDNLTKCSYQIFLAGTVVEF